MAVIFLFLTSVRATIVPAVTIPIALLGACAGIAVAGFSINILTLFALILAIGLVVDDAIVVLENIERRVEEGDDPKEAARAGANQVFFAVVSTSAVLISVFVPLSFLAGRDRQAVSANSASRWPSPWRFRPSSRCRSVR